MAEKKMILGLSKKFFSCYSNWYIAEKLVKKTHPDKEKCNKKQKEIEKTLMPLCTVYTQNKIEICVLNTGALIEYYCKYKMCKYKSYLYTSKNISTSFYHAIMQESFPTRLNKGWLHIFC